MMPGISSSTCGDGERFPVLPARCRKSQQVVQARVMADSSSTRRRMEHGILHVRRVSVDYLKRYVSGCRVLLFWSVRRNGFPIPVSPRQNRPCTCTACRLGGTAEQVGCQTRRSDHLTACKTSCCVIDEAHSGTSVVMNLVSATGMIFISRCRSTSFGFESQQCTILSRHP